MTDLAWEAVKSEFAFDGSWLDIYVLGTDMAAWQRMLDGLRSAGYDVAYFRGREPGGQAARAELPARAEDAFPLEGWSDRLLSVAFGRVVANCHFFTSEEIEFDIDPREVGGQAQLEALLAFMQCLAASVGREAILCPENSPQHVILRVHTDGAAQYQATRRGQV